MTKLFDKAYLIFLLAIPLILLVGFLDRDSNLDVNAYDTYYIISYWHSALWTSIVFGIIGVGYWLMQKAGNELSKWMTWAHIALTFGGMLVVWILSTFYQAEAIGYEFKSSLTIMTSLSVLVLVFGQLIFPVNLILGLLKRETDKA